MTRSSEHRPIHPQRHGPVMKTLIRLAVAALTIHAAPALAQTRTATGSIQIERALTMSSVQPMSFVAARRNIQAAAGEDSAVGTPAVIDITGDPGRIYRIRLPASIEAETGEGLIDGFRVWSETAGDVSRTLAGRLNEQGTDRLHISGSLSHVAGVSFTDLRAAVPVSVDYE